MSALFKINGHDYQVDVIAEPVFIPAAAAAPMAKHQKDAFPAGRLYSVTDGWIAGLRFLLSRLERKDDEEFLDYVQIFDYLTHEVVGRLDRQRIRSAWRVSPKVAMQHL